MFSVGLSNVFDVFTRGYRPKEHLSILFEALCRSNGFDPISIRDLSQQTLQAVQGNSLQDIENWMKHKGEGAPDKLENELENLSNGKTHYNRLITIGLLTLLNGTSLEKENNQENINKLIIEVSDIFGFSKTRVQRDISQYSSTLEKMSQALELMKESIEHERKKKELIKEKPSINNDDENGKTNIVAN